MHYSIKLFETGPGKVPFLDWLRGLKDLRAKTAIRVRVDRLSLGNFGDCKSVGDGVMELRIDLGPGYRVYFGMREQVVILLLCGGDKRSQERDIVKAKEYFKGHKKKEHDTL